MTDNVTVHGTTTTQTTGSYGNNGCDRTLHVTYDGNDVYVPWDNVQKHAYDFHGCVPESFNTTHVVVYDGRIHAECRHNDGSATELLPDYDEQLREFHGYDNWSLQYFAETFGTDGTVVYEREE